MKRHPVTDFERHKASVREVVGVLLVAASVFLLLWFWAGMP